MSKTGQNTDRKRRIENERAANRRVIAQLVLGRYIRASASRLRAPRFISGTWNAKSSGKLLKLSEVKEHLHARNLTIHHRPYMGAVRRPVARTRGGSPFGLSQSPHTG